MISVQSISKSFGVQKVLSDVSFSMMPGERIGLVGRNGHGKTTLLRIITGEEHPDGGTVTLPKGYTVGCLDQHARFTQETVLEEACLALRGDRDTEEWRVKKVLSGLGFAEEDFSRPIDEFSGGYQMRLNLAKVLVEGSNLLLLDEPTNFLDIVSIRWLESFLASWRGEILLITHDRTFMDRVVSQVMGIHRTMLRKVRGTTTAYYEQIAQEEEIHENRRVNEEKKQKQMEAFIDKFRAKARQANLAQSRVKALEKREKLDKLSKIVDLSFSFNATGFSAKQMMQVPTSFRILKYSFTKKFSSSSTKFLSHSP